MRPCRRRCPSPFIHTRTRCSYRFPGSPYLPRDQSRGIRVFDPHGVPKARPTLAWRADSAPRGLAFDRAGQLFVCIRKAGCDGVRVVDATDGHEITFIALDSADQVAIDADGIVYVACTNLV